MSPQSGATVKLDTKLIFSVLNVILLRASDIINLYIAHEMMSNRSMRDSTKESQRAARKMNEKQNLNDEGNDFTVQIDKERRNDAASDGDYDDVAGG